MAERFPEAIVEWFADFAVKWIDFRTGDPFPLPLCKVCE